MSLIIVSIAQFKRQVQSRLTKGEAFSMNRDEWNKRQEQVKTELDQMSFDEIKVKYPSYSYGLKVRNGKES